MPRLFIVEIEFVLNPIVSFFLYKFASFLELPLVRIALFSLSLIKVHRHRSIIVL